MDIINRILHWILFSWVSKIFVWLLIAYVIIVVLIVLFVFIIASPEKTIALITSLTTITLAFAAFWTIWQNYKFRTKDKKEKLLNDIIEWANDVNTQFQNLTIFEPDLFNTFFKSSMVALGLSNKGWFMKLIAETSLKNEELKYSISSTGKAIGIFGASLRYLSDRVISGEFLMMKLSKKQKEKFTNELDVLLESYIKTKYIKDIVTKTGKLEENMRKKAMKTLEVCANIKNKLL